MSEPLTHNSTNASGPVADPVSAPAERRPGSKSASGSGVFSPAASGVRRIGSPAASGSGIHSPGEIPGSGVRPPAPTAVLLAEDDPVAAMLVKRGLEQHGFRVLGPAAGGQEAVALAAEGKPDIAVLDIAMPGMDGLAVAEHLQNRLGIPAVILSAHTEPEYLARARTVGVSGYLVKPARTEELAVAVDLALTRFRQMQTLAERIAVLESNLNDRKLIERAKGVLMRAKTITEEEAYLRLQKASRRTHRKMVDVARSVLDAEGLELL